MSQINRIRSRRILTEELATSSISTKIFGTANSRTNLYNTVLEKWSENETGSFKFIFTPSADKTSLDVAVSAEDGADARAASQIQSETESAVANLKSTDMSGLTGDFVYMLPSSVTYSKEEIEMEESLRLIRESIRAFLHESYNM